VDTAAAISERLVEGLRPLALDELGLDGAIRQHASGLRTDGGRLVEVSVSAPDPLPGLTAAVEVAAYRIVVEALTNVTRHAAASKARVDLTVDDDLLRVTVTDDGSSSSEWRPGVGLSSMQERAHQVGGTLTASPCAGGGRVQADIPLQTTPT
jgi:two-component system NarL family sensor kinase